MDEAERIFYEKPEYSESELEKVIISKIEHFLLEIDKGFGVGTVGEVGSGALGLTKNNTFGSLLVVIY